MKHFRVFGAILFLAALFLQFSCTTIFGGFSLTKNRNLWKESKIRNYRMTMEIRKTGHATPSGFAVVEVRDGKAVSINPAPGLQMGCWNNNCSRYETVEQIFAIIEDAQKQSPEELITEYDAQYGYPTHVRMDIAKRTFDDELMIKIMQLEVIE